jgi:hypothetical protein
MTASLAILSLFAFLVAYEAIDALWDRGSRPAPAGSPARDLTPVVGKGG